MKSLWQGARKRCKVAIRDQQARATRDHRLAHAAGVDADHWPAGGLCLDRDEAELLDVGHHQRRGLGVQPSQFQVVHSAQELGLAW